MKTQFKKGILELLVLLVVSKKDIYGYELVQIINETTSVNEGTIYPILKRLSNEGYFETYTKESNEGPSRKYYKITETGLDYSKKVLKQYYDFTDKINNFLKGFDLYE